MSRIIFFVLGLVMMQAFAALDRVKQAEELLTEDILPRAKRDLVGEAENLLNRNKRAVRTFYAQEGGNTKLMQIKMISLD